MEWMIYGAYGYTGRLIAAEAVRRGMRPTLAGRSKRPLKALGDELGLPTRVFSLIEHAGVVAGLEGMAAVLNCAGPFLDTNKPLLKACLEGQTHYLDITGEVPVFERVMKWRDSFVKAGVCAIPGVGFDVVPSDCLALMLRDAVPDATQLLLGIRLESTASPGTARTFVHALPAGGLARKDGAIKLVPPAWKTRGIDFGDGPELTMTIPWGDISTAFHSAGFGDIEAYFKVPRWALWTFRLTRPIRFVLLPRFMRDGLGAMAARLYSGPDDALREASGVRVWGQAIAPSGARETLLLRGPDGYELTTDSALHAVQEVLGGGVEPGGYTPGMAFGARFLGRLKGVSVEQGRP